MSVLALTCVRVTPKADAGMLAAPASLFFQGLQLNEHIGFAHFHVAVRSPLPIAVSRNAVEAFRLKI